jgi:hypothetical protein
VKSRDATACGGSSGGGGGGGGGGYCFNGNNGQPEVTTKFRTCNLYFTLELACQ